jgi:hypothetical protein
MSRQIAVYFIVDTVSKVGLLIESSLNVYWFSLLKIRLLVLIYLRDFLALGKNVTVVAR